MDMNSAAQMFCTKMHVFQYFLTSEKLDLMRNKQMIDVDN